MVCSLSSGHHAKGCARDGQYKCEPKICSPLEEQHFTRKELLVAMSSESRSHRIRVPRNDRRTPTQRQAPILHVLQNDVKMTVVAVDRAKILDDVRVVELAQKLNLGVYSLEVSSLETVAPELLYRDECSRLPLPSLVNYRTAAASNDFTHYIFTELHSFPSAVAEFSALAARLQAFVGGRPAAGDSE